MEHRLNGRKRRRPLPTLACAAATTAACLWVRPARGDFTWRGTTSSTWTDTTNWDSAAAPAYGSTNATSRLNIYNFNTTSGAPIVPATYDPVAAGLSSSTDTTFAFGTSNRGLVVANSGSGDAGLVVNSGTLTIGGSANPILANAQNGYITVNGGLLDSSGTTSTGLVMLYGNNNGIYNATISVGSGGEFRTKLLDLDNGNLNTSSDSGIVLNAGGVLTTTGLVDTQGKAIATVTFNGGTLRAGGSSTTFLNALANTTVLFNASGGTVDTNGFNISIAAPLTASAASTGGGLSKVGSGTLSLTASNSYAGGTTISAGQLLANNATSSLGTGTTTVTAGLLAGTGATGGPVNLSGGSISAGTGPSAANAVGKLTVGVPGTPAPLTQTAASTYYAKIDGTQTLTATGQTPHSGTGTVYTGGSDEMVLSVLTINAGTLTVSPVVVSAGSLTNTATSNNSYDLVVADSTAMAPSAFAALFSSIKLPSTTPAGGSYALDYASDGNGGTDLLLDFTPSATPEPTSFLLVVSGIAPLALGRRRARCGPVRSAS